MPNTHDVGRVYSTRVPYLDKSSPLTEKGWTIETEHPYRRGTCRAFRIPLTRFGFAVGLWGPPGDEFENLVDASGARELDNYSLDDFYEMEI